MALISSRRPRPRPRRGDETIPGIFRGRTPVDSPDLFHRISPFYHASEIKTPLMLVVGDKDQPRYDSNKAFYDALLIAGRPGKLVVYQGEGHQLSNAELATTREQSTPCQ